MRVLDRGRLKTNRTHSAVIEISGAGPAGLSAALAVVKAGARARVYERKSDVGHRFHGDFQGLENWTTETDVLQELHQLGVKTDFEVTPFSEVVCFGPGGGERRVRSTEPLFYLLRRGPDSGTLDQCLKQQALVAGVEIRFNESVARLPQGGVVTAGPHRADAVAVGYLFGTDRADAAYAAISDQLAPGGYAYLLISGGRATLATCLFRDFHRERVYLQRCVEFFSDRVGIRLDAPRRFGGSGNFGLPKALSKGGILYAGEAAGIQDPLFGFGIRSALLSGAAAGRALAERSPGAYTAFYRRRLRGYHKSAACNRWFYGRLGDAGYRKLLMRYPAEADIRKRMRRAYAPRRWKQLWYDLYLSRHYPSVLELHAGCDCTWCRCQRQSNRE